MRWFLRRLAFYVFAIWLALTINVFAPAADARQPDRRHPAAPVAGADPGEPGDHRHVREDLRRQGRVVWPTAYWQYLTRGSAPQLRHLDLELSGHRVRGDRAHAPVLDRCSSASRSSSRSSIGSPSAWSRPGGAAAASTRLRAALHGRSARSPPTSPRCSSSTSSGSSSAGSRSSTRTATTLTPGFNWTFIWSAVRHAELPALVIVARVRRRLGAEHAHGDDQHDRRGLRRDGAAPRVSRIRA